MIKFIISWVSQILFYNIITDIKNLEEDNNRLRHKIKIFQMKKFKHPKKERTDRLQEITYLAGHISTSVKDAYISYDLTKKQDRKKKTSTYLQLIGNVANEIKDIKPQNFSNIKNLIPTPYNLYTYSKVLKSKAI